MCSVGSEVLDKIKDIAVKLSGAYKQCKRCTGSPTLKKGQRGYPEFDTSSGVPYPNVQPESSSSTLAWDFTRTGNHQANRVDSGFARPRRSANVSTQSAEVSVKNKDEPGEWMSRFRQSGKKKLRWVYS
ncbi:protein BREVIS RADIX-like isoform X1 [Apium graveolens]|uniref:protein BREVIS RADIX-like isoform X1 n=1 Tax=Apium graveolens TaxID=4045 RepID=UPI003D7A6501